MASSSKDWRSFFGLRRKARPQMEPLPAKPYRRTAFKDPMARSLVARTRFRGDIDAATRSALALLTAGQPSLSADDGPLILPRFGGGPPPLSTAPDFLQAVVEALRDLGSGPVRVLDSRGESYPEPRDLDEACRRMGCELVDVREGPWVRVQVGASLGTLTVPRVAYEVERLVMLPSPLVNSATRFSMGLALAQELLHPSERLGLTKGQREERLVELNLAVRPWLLLMDARRALVSDEQRLIREPGYVLASGDPVALDVAALKLLKGYPAKNRLDMPAWAFPQITAAINLGLGAAREDDTRLLEG